jgi:hypothetical protein
MPLTYKTIGDSYVRASYSVLFPVVASYGATTSTSITINFSGPYTTYNLIRTNISQGNTTTTINGLNGTSYIDTSLIPNNNYSYQISASNQITSSNPVNIGSIWTLASVISASATLSSSILLNWSGYYTSIMVSRNDLGGTFQSPLLNYPASNSPSTNVTGNVTDINVTGGNTYTYTIIAYNGSGQATTITNSYSASLPQSSPANCVLNYNFDLVDLSGDNLHIYNYAKSSWTSTLNIINTTSGIISAAAAKFGTAGFFGSPTTGGASLYITTDNITIPTPIDNTTSGFTVSFWCYPRSGLNNSYIFQSSNLKIGFTSNTLNCYLNGNWATNPNGGFSTNVWYHVVMVVSYTGAIPYTTSTGTASYTFYINGGTANGGQQYTGSSNYMPVGTISGMIGYNSITGGNGGAFAGYIDNFRAYNSIPTPSQITSLYNGAI